MEINKIVFMCKDNHALLDDMLRNKEITISDYQKAKMILDDAELCQLSCIKYEQSLTVADKISSTIKDIDTTAVKENGKRKVQSVLKSKVVKGITAIIALALISASGFYIYMNFIYKYPIDIAGNTHIYTDTYNFSGEGTSADIIILNNMNYWNNEGDYKEVKSELKTNYKLSDKEIEAFIPKYDLKTLNYMNNLSITPKYSKTENIRNGDTIKIDFKYDEEFAKENHLDVTNTSISYKVTDMKEKITEDNYKTADTSEFDELCTKYGTEEELKKASDQIEDKLLGFNKIGSCGYLVEDTSNLYQGMDQAGYVVFEANITTSDRLSREESTENVELLMPFEAHINDGKYKVKAKTDSILVFGDDYQEYLASANYLVIKKAEDVDMASDN